MSARRVELVYFTGCPHVEATRDALREALIAETMEPTWTEWNRDDDTTPEALRQYGSPTVLVDGCDVAPASSGEVSCRIYHDEGRARDAPGVATIRAALAVQSNNGKKT